LTQAESPFAALHIEHIIPRKHRGDDSADNLALACVSCNIYKGANLTGIDPVTMKIEALFHPRRQQWADHFMWREREIVGISPVGRTTVEVLRLN